jgi:hypothetical protein
MPALPSQHLHDLDDAMMVMNPSPPSPLRQFPSIWGYGKWKWTNIRASSTYYLLPTHDEIPTNAARCPILLQHFHDLYDAISSPTPAQPLNSS